MERFLCLGLIFVAVGNYRDVSAEKPTMIPRLDELVIEKGDKIKLECYSEGAQVHFSYPERTFMSPRSMHNISRSDNGMSTFLRPKAVSLDTGWYACAAEGVEIENHFKILNHTHEEIAWIYIYVTSSKQFADRHYSFPKSVIVTDGKPAIVPCRPLSAKSEVQLWRNSEIVRLGQGIHYDPRIGFVIEKLVFEDLVIHFHCEASGVKDRYDLYYSKGRGEKPKMIPDTEEHMIVEGDELRLECHGKSELQFLYQQETEGMSITTSNSETSYGKYGDKIFIRHSTIAGDTGWYGCAEKGVNTDIPFRNYIDYTRTEISWIYVYVHSASTRLIGSHGVEAIMLKNGVQYVDGNDIVIPCRPTSPDYSVKLIIDLLSMQPKKNAYFDSKYGFIIRHELGDSLFCSLCLPEPVETYLVVCSRKVAGAERDLFLKPGQLILLTGEDLLLSYARVNINKLSREKWITPRNESSNRLEKVTSTATFRQLFPLTTEHIFYALTLKNVTKSDSGDYVFQIKQPIAIRNTMNPFVVLVVDRNKWEYKKLNLQDTAYTLPVRRRNESLRLMVDLHSFSSGIIHWMDPSGQLIERSVDSIPKIRRYHLTRRFRNMLVVNNLTLDDGGVYQMRISTSIGVIFVNFTLDVQVTPIVSIVNGSHALYTPSDKRFRVTCCALASPRPDITWTFLKQPEYPSNDNSYLGLLPSQTYVVHNKTFGCSDLIMSTDSTGILYCTACNSINCSSTTRRIFLSGSVGRFGIISPTEQPYLGDDVTLKCAGSIHAFKMLWWNTNFDKCYKNVSDRTFLLKEYPTRLMIQKVLHIPNVTKCHRRSYLCSGKTINGSVEVTKHDLRLDVPQKPEFIRPNLKKSRILFDKNKLGSNVTHLLDCCANGKPHPNVTWFKNDHQLRESEEHQFSPGACKLTVLLDLRNENDKRYKCKVENRFGKIEDWIDFVVGSQGEDETTVSAIVAVALALIGVLIAWFVLQKRQIKESRRKYKEAILKRFEEGALNYLRIGKNMADQAEILPFDKKWEYPRNLLKFDKLLGSGSFGVVRKAEAKSICPGKKTTIVAVKMVRATHRLHYMTALIRELKVLVHLGSHLNIVNLLGACTKNISFGELLVIVEFCRFGNLHDYLFRRRADFVDQIDPVTEEIIGPNFGTDRIGVGSNREQIITDCDNYSESGPNCEGTDATEDDEKTNYELLAKGLIQPGLRSNYRGDDPDLIGESICTKDLLCWAWQVTRGMGYLGLRKVVHGDLAARNVLLADNNVIKICDFGLAEILYKNEDYKKLCQDLLPLRWMAIESMNDRTFSFQSDVWSYGVFLWELFTLADTPYHGIDPRNLNQKLNSGYRLSRPKYAPKEMYNLMERCWEAKPARRPTFAKLEKEVANQLDNGIHTHYVDMDPLYTEFSNETEETGKIDYLTMDQSQIKTVLFSAGQERVNLGFGASNELRDTACLSINLEDSDIVFS